MRFTAKFAGGGAGSRDRNTGIAYYPFDVARINAATPQEARDKAVANAVQHIRDMEAFKNIDLLEVLIGHFLPPNYYSNPARQAKVEKIATRIELYEYRPAATNQGLGRSRVTVDGDEWR